MFIIGSYTRTIHVCDFCGAEFDDQIKLTQCDECGREFCGMCGQKTVLSIGKEDGETYVGLSIAYCKEHFTKDKAVGKLIGKAGNIKEPVNIKFSD